MVNAIQKIFPAGLKKFFTLVIISIVFNYFAPAVIKDLWYFFVLYLYYRSKDEPLWLAFFLVLNDGFGSFFGYRGANISSIPFLPQFEVGHLYVMMSVLKIFKHRIKVPVFYSKFMSIMLLYIIFMYIYGLFQGSPSGYNIHFRSIRIIFPLFLIYTIPTLLRVPADYDRLFSFIFIIGIIAFLAQIFSIITGASPIVFLGISEGAVTEVSETTTYRGFYNVSATLLSFFASMYYLTVKTKVFDRNYMQIVLVASMGTALLSATRGWFLGLGFTLILFLIVVSRFNIKRFLMFAVPLAILLLIGLLQPKINQQIQNALKRFKTLGAIMEGDLSAGGTASRATIQGPAVLKVWREHPILGWGYSDTFYKNQNGHVGNENVLLHSGIIGVSFMIAFFIYFHLKLVYLSGRLSGFNPYGRSFLVFPVFFVAMFIIHSTSGQLFGYMTTYRAFFVQAVFFGFGATMYNHVIMFIRGDNPGYAISVRQ